MFTAGREFFVGFCFYHWPRVNRFARKDFLQVNIQLRKNREK